MEQLLRTPEVAKKLSRSVRIVQRLINQGRLPAQREAGKKFWWIREEDVQKVRGRLPGRPKKPAVINHQAAPPQR